MNKPAGDLINISNLKERLIVALRSAVGCLRQVEIILATSCRRNRKHRVVIGAGGTKCHGWVSTDKYTLNLLNEADWKLCFSRKRPDILLAEHVWEHLSEEEAVLALRNCYKYLNSNGLLRIAVPDGFNPDKNYIDHVRPGGRGPGADDHKVLYNYKTLSSVLERAGFRVHLLEYFDESGIFHMADWDVEDGKILRSARYDPRNNGDNLVYTSVIVDALKTNGEEPRRS